jgi:hypothetical protein
MQNGEAIAVRSSKSGLTSGVLCFDAAKVLGRAANSTKYHCHQKHPMCVVGVVFKTAPGRARDVALRMTKFDGLEIIGVDADSRLTAVWKQWSFASLEQSADCALADDDEHLFPVFFGCY